MAFNRLNFCSAKIRNGKLRSHFSSTHFQTSVAFFGQSCVLELVAMGLVRKPIEKRDVEIIRRLKHVIKMHVFIIARAVGRHKKTVYKCLKKKWKAPLKGRPKSLARPR